MTLHKDLTGFDLHGTKIPLAQPTRLPAYVGETIFDGEKLWVATSLSLEGWKDTRSTPPPAFSWVVDLASFAQPYDQSLTKVSLFFRDCPINEVDQFADSFALVKTWVIGVDLFMRSPIDLTPSVQACGPGAYVLALTGQDLYGADDVPILDHPVALVFEHPSPVVQLFNFTQDFTGLNGVLCPSLNGFYVMAPLAQVLLEVS